MTLGLEGKKEGEWREAEDGRMDTMSPLVVVLTSSSLILSALSCHSC